MAARAIIRATEDHIRVLDIAPSQFMEDGEERLQANIAYFFTRLEATAEELGRKAERRRRGFSLFGKKDLEDTYVVLIDEFEELALKKAELEFNQLGGVNAILRGIDRVKRNKYTKNIVFLLTTNYSGKMDPAVRNRTDIVRFYQPDQTSYMHHTIKNLSDVMYSQDDN